MDTEGYIFMKRSWSIIMVYIFLFSFAYIVPINAENVSSLSNEAATVLTYLGIVEKDDNGRINTQEYVSRSTFAAYVARLLRMPSNDSEKTYFIDVPLSHWASESINFLYEMNLLSPSIDRKFRPDDGITYSEACKILVSAAGYGIYAENNGGYPNGYLSAASNMKLYLTNSSDAILNTGEALELIYSAFSAETYTPYAFGDYGSVEYRVSENSLLYIHWDIAFHTGIIKSTFGESVEGEVIKDRNEVRIDDQLYCVSSGVSLNDLLGCKVNIVYVSHENTNSKYKGEIIYTEVAAGTIDLISISSKDITGFDKSTYTLTYIEKNNHKREIDIPKEIIVIYNGMPTLRALGDIVFELISKERIGSLRLVGSGDTYDTIVVESYVSFVLREFDQIRGYLYDELHEGNFIDIGSYDVVKVINGNGLAEDISVLSAGNALSVAISDTASTLKILYSDDTLLTNLSAISDNGLPKFTLNDEEFEVEYSFYEELGKNLTLGEQYSFSVDSFGRIVFAKQQKDAVQQAAYLIAASIDWPSTFIKMFTGEGEMKIFELADRVTVDGKVFNGYGAPVMGIDAIPGTTGIYDMNDPYSAVNKPVISPQVILYRLNTQNQINWIDTCYVNEACGEEAETTLIKTTSQFKKKMAQHISAASYYRFDTNLLYSKEDTLVFCIPYADAAGNLLVDNNKTRAEINEYAGGNDKISFDDDDYSVNTVTFLAGRSYIVEGYKYNSSNPYNDIILCMNPLYTDYDAPIMVSKISEALNANGDVVTRILGYASGAEVICDVNKDEFSNDLNAGDLIRGFMGTDGKFTNIKKVYDVNENKFLNKPGTYNDTPEWWYDGTTQASFGYMYFNPAWQMSLGYVSEKNGNIVRWSYTNPTLNEDKNHYDEVWDLSVIPITVFDKESKKENVYRGTVADIVDYKSGAENCSRIILFSRSSSVISAYIYK